MRDKRSLEDAPETVNSDAYTDGWFFKMQPADMGNEELLDAEGYGKSAEAEAH